MLLTKYITLDEYAEYFGAKEDLRIKLGSEEEALAFLKRVEDRMAIFIDSSFNKNIDAQFPVFSEYQKECYKKALLEQAIYVFKNGDIGVDSGYDRNSGMVAKKSDLDSITLAPFTIKYLRACGLYNRNIGHRGLFSDGRYL